MHFARITVAITVVLLASVEGMSAAPVDQGVTDQKGKNPDRAKGLDEKAREVIARQKVLITDEAFKQVFTPYLSSGLPLFITSDSLLNAYHVLHEETVLRIEMTNALRLPLVLRQLWQGLERADEKVTGKPELVAGAKRRAQVVIATALRLMGEEAIPCGPEVAALADKEVEKIKAATAVEKPAWLGPPDDGFLALDYSRFKPRGFYTRGPLLERYFRAVSWLQAIPFRLDKDEEFLAILLLNRGLGSGSIQDVAGDAWFSPADFLECFGQFIGAADDRPGLMAAPWLRDKLDLNLEGPGWKWQRERVAQEHEGRPQPWSMINDQIALPPDNPAEAAEAQFRILPARRTPDAVLFQRTTDLRQFTRPLPTGLEVAAALGSAFAADRLTGRDRERVLEKIRETQPLFVGDNLYLDYLGCLAALVDKPEPDAPAFMSGEAWQTKSCQTVLGGWAQIRHAFVLQAKQTAFYGCDSSMPCGFVEPEPTFFGRLARLIEKTEALLQKQGELADEFTPVAPRLRAAADMLEKKGFATNSDLTLKDLTREEFELIAQAQRFDGVLRTIPYEPRATKDTAGDKDAVAKKGPGRAESIKKAIAHLREVAAILEQGKLPERYSYAVGWKRSTEYLKTLWHRLGTVARRLETLAHKQLRGVEFDEEEKRFILGYGVQLGHLMFYDGNSYYAPKDDAPRVVDVYVNNWEEKVLEVGIGRPRAIYVLYPYKGGEVLCRGAVMPYYEFPSGERLTDEQWKTLLDSKDSPDVPDWAKPIIGPGMIKPAAPAKE